MKRVFDWFGGRSMFVALTILQIGAVLAATHRLDGNFVALCGVIQTLVTARAISGDRSPGAVK